MPIIGKLIKKTTALSYKRSQNKSKEYYHQVITLVKLLERSKNTKFGKLYKYKEILSDDESVDAFQAFVPITEYADYYENWLKAEGILTDEMISQIKDSDAVIVSDYNKGFLSEKTLRFITDYSKFTIMDTKKKITDDILSYFDFVKLNESEFSKHNFNKDLINRVIVTLGSKGAKYIDKVYPSPDPKETIDVSGAGDTFTASFTLKY